jgi:rhamnose utilization protein RhaD (predicted bifunctional aldolase and dehydrogenase)
LLPHRSNDEIISLLELSARIGRDILLTQANTGNTSIKIGQHLWIKASGTWLADANRQNILMRLDLAKARASLRGGVDPLETRAWDGDEKRQPSIETALHVTMPHRVVIHVHSVNVIAWAVRRDGPACLAERLEGLRWRWIPYTPSGVPLAQEVGRALSEAPDTDVFILANHGLVVGGPNSARSEALLWEVERRVALTARRAPKANSEVLRRIADGSEWYLADNVTVHALATDPVSAGIVAGGLLFPCQAIFSSSDPEEAFRPVGSDSLLHAPEKYRSRPFLIVEECGVLTHRSLSACGSAILTGFAQVVRRIPQYAAVRYLTPQDMENLDAANYDAAAKDASA